MRVVAILAAYNEERFIGGCLEHLFEHGVETYLIDNASTDRTVEIAEGYRGRGLAGVESFPRDHGEFSLHAQLLRKEQLAAALDADWFMHMDADEIRLPPRSGQTLAEAFEQVEARGYNAVNFIEFTFVPTREGPDHDHPDFQKTMKSYYPFMLNYPYQIKAWKNQPEPVSLAHTGGHKVRFPNLRVYPESFKMRHYPFLSVPYYAAKYLSRRYDASELERGWHGWRSRLTEEMVELPSRDDLNIYTTDDALDISNPRTKHVAAEWAAPAAAPPGTPMIVGGCYRSGTSLLRRMLNAHPRIHCGPEVKFFRDLHSDYVNDPIRHGRFLTSARQMLPEDELLDVVGGAFVEMHEKSAAASGKPRWADKNPENVLHLHEWQRLLGDAWVFIHVVRNPLDTLASIKEAEFPLVIPQSLEERIALYKRYTQAGLDFGDLHPGRCHRVVYEELVEDPERVVSGLMNWLGERFDPVQLDFNSVEQQGGLEDPKVGRTKNVHRGSVGRWKELLTPEEARKISRECDALWRRASTMNEVNPRGKTFLRRFGRKVRSSLGLQQGGRSKGADG